MVGPEVRLPPAGGAAAGAAPPVRRARPERETSSSGRSAAGRRLTWWIPAALLPVLAALTFDLYGLLEERRVNAMLARNDIALVAERDTVRGRLARAYRLHASGRLKEAIAAYGAIALESEPELREVRHFNLANLYLERAVELERAEEIQSAMSLVELAKQNYREILARDPHHWDARYNLSRALEMLPDIAAVDYENELNPERSPQAPQAARTYEGLP